MKSFFVLATMAFASVSQAALLWDFGMTTGTYGGSWQNQTALQNFAEKATFATGVTINQYIYITNFDPSTFASTMHVKVLADNAGVPGAVITSQDVSVASSSLLGTFSGNNVFQAVLNLTPINLGAGSYWFGASGNGFEAAQVSLNPGPGNNLMAQFNGSTYGQDATVGDQAFQLMGSAVPEPTTLLVLGGLSVLAMRRRRKA